MLAGRNRWRKVLGVMCDKSVRQNKRRGRQQHEGTVTVVLRKRQAAEFEGSNFQPLFGSDKDGYDQG